jgi:hypothetical protein
MGDRQLDLPATNSSWYILPRELPMRLNGEDFINFIWYGNVNPSRYTVVIESLDTAGPTYRAISKLQKRVEIPLVMFGWDAKIGVIPDVDSLPAFQAKFVRGSTYLIPETSKNGVYTMDRFGKDRPPGM